jgi:uncharacterized paraquat-inducible protein A
MRNKYHLIEEFFDEMQTKLGLLELVGIAAQEVTDQYYKHEEKLKNRPRKKKTCLKCFNMQHKEIKYICLKCGQEVERQDFNSYANECSYYKET